jgi:hypothetical protein
VQTSFGQLAPKIKIFPACPNVIVPSDRRPRGFGNESHSINVVAEHEPHRIPVCATFQLFHCAEGLDERVDKCCATVLSDR